MSVLSKGASKWYKISDAWLDDLDGPGYIDIEDIMNYKNTDTGNAYVEYLINNAGISTTFADEAVKAYMTVNGIMVGNTDSGTVIRGILMADTHIETNNFAGTIVHPIRFRRIYRSGTTARSIAFVGYER